ncbi:hypothetical protein TWF694_005509 [Orbilia ellipsospora]|uniref:Uncharacterized protein n=1 Tax=Orbilia ellipsospora TaxID=2528407 RepID=A0AAV9WTC8_9PEZI
MAPRRSAKRTSARTEPYSAPPSNERSQRQEIAETPLSQENIPRNKRWSKVSISGNLDTEYTRHITSDNNAYRYICLCRPPFSDDDIPSESSLDPELDPGSESDSDSLLVTASDDSGTILAQRTRPGDKGRCDGGVTCICLAATRNQGSPRDPQPKWILTKAAHAKFIQLQDHCDIRDPANFDMYTYNDHASYGVIEVIENLLLDFNEAKGNWQEQWVICEALGYFLPTRTAQDMFTVDDGDRVNALCLLLGRLFLYTLSRFQHLEFFLDGASEEIENLGLVMGLWIAVTAGFRENDCLQIYESQDSELSLGEGRVFKPAEFDSYIASYAREYDIELKGSKDLPLALETCNNNVDLPTKVSDAGPGSDPFGYRKAFRDYKAGYGKIGGDRMDVTSWSRHERRSAHFDNIDPFGPNDIQRIKEGECMSFA